MDTTAVATDKLSVTFGVCFALMSCPGAFLSTATNTKCGAKSHIDEGVNLNSPNVRNLTTQGVVVLVVTPRVADAFDLVAQGDRRETTGKRLNLADSDATSSALPIPENKAGNRLEEMRRRAWSRTLGCRA